MSQPDVKNSDTAEVSGKKACKTSIPKEKKKLIILPSSADGLIKIYANIIENRLYGIGNSPLDMPIWLSLFCYYENEFCNTYNEYITSPDESVRVIKDIEEYMKEHPVISIPRKQSITGDDIRATCHMIIISMNKTFALVQSERERQIKLYLHNRKQAVYSSLVGFVGDLITTDEFFITIRDVFRVLPKFRKRIFFFCYENQIKPEFSKACVLLSYSAMTTIKHMLDFTRLAKKTLAHSDPTVLKEIHRFMQIIKKKEEKEGPLWPYHRILHPTDGDLRTANFPNLAVASIVYMKKYGLESFKYMVTPNFPTVPNLIEKATTFDTTFQRTTFSSDALLGAKIIGLNVEKLMELERQKERASTSKEELSASPSVFRPRQ